MTRIPWLVFVGIFCCATAEAPAAGFQRESDLERVSRQLHGTVIDYTNNNGADRRLWSPALQEWRDLYVYLPPGFDPRQQYPLMLYLHGYGQDEQYFLKNQLALFDEAIVNGQLPPVIIAWPDGSIQGRTSFFRSATFFANSRAGRFEDYLMQDIWDFLFSHFPLRPEREAHVIVGVSMGGSAVFRLAITHQERFKIAIGFFPAVNMRWVDCHERYRTRFDPCCWGWRSKLRPNEVMGLAYGIIPVRFKVLMDPMFSREEALEKLSQGNPIELLDPYDVREGQLDMYMGYGGKDEFYIHAQVESFLYKAKERGLTVGVEYLPDGKHDLETGKKLFPGAVKWVAPLLAPYSPPLCPPVAADACHKAP